MATQSDATDRPERDGEGGEDMSEEIKEMIPEVVRKLETLPPMQQSMCVGFVLGAAATENTKKDEKEAG